MAHTTVLLHESIAGLHLKKGDVFLDGTLGGGGHSDLVCQNLKGNITIIGIDKDASAIKKSGDRLRKSGCEPLIMKGSFKDLDLALKKYGIKQVNGILFDLGISSDQLDSSGRGFSFLRDEPLLMTMESKITDETLTAKDIVNSWSEESLADIIYGYGEERYARRIAKRIIEARNIKSIETTFDLVDIIRSSVPKEYRAKKIHPATKTFQALRIAVNDELQTLEEGMKKGFESLAKKGRMAIISFHSLEDRLVKRFFKQKENEGVAKLITKKPITPTDEEVKSNSRSRSAKLRVIEKI
ncbi:MAG: 16S rRNA (cytosine(1402)-N(4))-methyltransferase RsmH [Candidatus Paceibacterota bacterium]|jgi:16S rRNA (cytosine1402-N4)-methyltransferase